ncbi:hypothetical protein K458DRAFT_353989 [Lentithecium fluviatile CBS 122367]|uniref:DUF8004 domain-containing protein n=1 Tax=Lentithecium fluviatile CBS 122367 TaxID=1168545 RepID=A0A6G1JN21_9PLEO|nr:hypothetical protein K458DRAFT_353989 [Lentithecium fluviatile CBS 122367]
MSIAPRRTAPAVGEWPRPRVHAPSHRLSLTNSSSGVPSSRRRNSVTAVGSVFAAGQTAGYSPPPSWRVRPNRARAHSLADKAYNLDFLQCDPTRTLSRRNSHSRFQDSTLRLARRSASCSAASRSPMRAAKVQRWAGLTREASEWDGLRRDPELWFEDGDCLVHLYARGQSRRGPAFCVPFSVLKQSNCGSMFSLCFAQMTAGPGTISQKPRRLSNGFSVPVSGSNKIELFVPAPDDVSREATFKWHLTTRNFFAYIFGKPLVGGHLGQALVDLQERMHLFRSGQINNSRDFLNYIESQGYRDFVDFPDYALAMLYYAEHYKLRDIWIDAFAHCVGMNESLAQSSEFAPLSRLTKALITRAYLEMDIHLGRVTQAMRHFLEDDLSPAYLGLPDGARAHLDRFRSFLHGFYVEKFGYWPPPKGSAFSKALLKSMYFDFRNLHDYLVDKESSADISSQKPASGGICVLQNVASFDRRHKFASLPHPLPLLPSDVPVRKRTESQKALRTLTLGSKQGKTDRYMTARASLTTATNGDDISVTSSAIVQAYMRFERQCALNQRDEKVSMADARKVRWLLIYGTLQYLASALRAPKEVRDTEKPNYPLCCLVSEQSPWQAGTKVLTSPLTQSINVPEAIDDFLSQSNGTTPGQTTPSTIEIEPDCQRQDYFSHTNTNAASSPVSVEVPAPLRISASRAPSGRSTSRRLSLSSLGSRRNSVQLKSTGHCEILVHGYGNGLHETIIDHPSVRSSIHSSSSVYSSQVPSRQPSILVNDPIQPLNLELNTNIPAESLRTPTLDSVRMEELVSPVASFAPWTSSSSSESTTSVDNPFWSDGASSVSSKSSTYAESVRKASPAEESGLLGGLVSFNSTSVHTPKNVSLPSTPITPNHRDEFRFSFDGQKHPTFSELLQDSPSSFHADPAIGIALSAPAPPPTGIPSAAPMGVLSFATSGNPSPTKRAFSPDPMRDNVIDIFSALDMSPKAEKPDPLAAKGIEIDAPRVALSGPPASKVPVKSQPFQLRNVAKMFEDEKGKLVAKRRSIFSLRL